MKHRASHHSFPVVLALALLSGCGPAEDPTAAGGSEDPVTQLLAPGSQPARALRYQVDSGLVQTAVLTIRSVMSARFDEIDIPAEEIPPTRSTLRLEPLDHPSDDAFEFRATIEQTEIIEYGSDLERLAFMNNEFMAQSPVGQSGTSVRSALGFVRSVSFETPVGASMTLRQYFDDLRRALTQLCVPLPPEEVGVGARWHATLAAEIMGMDIQQSAEYELLSLEGDVLRIGIDGILMAQPQIARLPRLPAGARCDLNALDAKVRGEFTIDLARTFPIAGEVDYSMQMDLSVQPDAQSELSSANTHIDLKYTVDEKGG